MKLKIMSRTGEVRDQCSSSVISKQIETKVQSVSKLEQTKYPELILERTSPQISYPLYIKKMAAGIKKGKHAVADTTTKGVQDVKIHYCTLKAVNPRPPPFGQKLVHFSPIVVSSDNNFTHIKSDPGITGPVNSVRPKKSNLKRSLMKFNPSKITKQTYHVALWKRHLDMLEMEVTEKLKCQQIYNDLAKPKPQAESLKYINSQNMNYIPTQFLPNI